MNAATHARLLALNRRFYEVHGASFDGTRGRPWPGWQRLLPHLARLPNPAFCLDLGCGNGRFAAFLADHGLAADYLGVDLALDLITSARRQNLRASRFVEADLLGVALWRELADQTFDLAVLFGVLHHIPSFASRRQLVERSAERLRPGGMLVYTHWRLDQDVERLSRMAAGSPKSFGLEEADLEPGDVLLTWKGDAMNPRYCHFPSQPEIEMLAANLALDEVDCFAADGPSGRDNLYRVLRKRMLDSDALGET
jgi:tRNA (uracil-5-)-methyltransferase TRM9